METSYRCTCGHDVKLEVETDGPEVLDVSTGDGELKCEVCGADLDRDEVYAKVSIDLAGDLVDAADPADR